MGLLTALASVLAVAAAAEEPVAGQPSGVGVQGFPDATGAIAPINVNGRVNGHGAFFQSLGTNGRSCATCHVAARLLDFSRPVTGSLFFVPSADFLGKLAT